MYPVVNPPLRDTQFFVQARCFPLFVFLSSSFVRSFGCSIFEEELSGGCGISHLRLGCFPIHHANSMFSDVISWYIILKMIIFDGM